MKSVAAVKFPRKKRSSYMNKVPAFITTTMKTSFKEYTQTRQGTTSSHSSSSFSLYFTFSANKTPPLKRKERYSKICAWWEWWWVTHASTLISCRHDWFLFYFFIVIFYSVFSLSLLQIKWEKENALMISSFRMGLDLQRNGI